MFEAKLELVNVLYDPVEPIPEVFIDASWVSADKDAPATQSPVVTAPEPKSLSLAYTVKSVLEPSPAKCALSVALDTVPRTDDVVNPINTSKQ